jgi:hypothetical protein
MLDIDAVGSANSRESAARRDLVAFASMWSPLSLASSSASTEGISNFVGPDAASLASTHQDRATFKVTSMQLVQVLKA